MYSISMRKTTISILFFLFGCFCDAFVVNPVQHRHQILKPTTKTRLHSYDRPIYNAGFNEYVKSIAPITTTDNADAINAASAVVSVDQYSLAWGLCLALSVWYAYDIVSSDGKRDYQLECQDGFCITDYGPNGEYMGPSPPDVPTNSHILAWNADLVFTFIAIALPVLHKYFGVPIFSIGEKYEFKTDTLVVISNVVLILFHGGLHKLLSKDFPEGKDKEIYDGNDGDENPIIQSVNGAVKVKEDEEGSKIGFILFSGILVAVNIIGYSSVPELLNDNVLSLGATIAAVTYFIYWLTLQATLKGLGISSYFMSTQVLISGVGFLFPNEKADPLMGWTFLITCIVSLVEYFNCKSFLRRVGGHVWYDVALHTSLLTAFWLEEPLKQASGVASRVLAL